MKLISKKILMMISTLSLLSLSGCFTLFIKEPKNPSLLEVKKQYEEDYNAREVYVGDSRIIIYIDVNKNDERYKKFIADKHNRDNKIRNHLTLVNKATRKKCNLDEMFSTWYNKNDEYNRGSKIKKYARCIGARIEQGYVRTQEINEHMYVMHELTRLPNSDYGQNYRIHGTGIVEPEITNPIIFANTKTRRIMSSTENSKIKFKYIELQIKAWRDQLDKYNVPYHVNMNLL